MSEDGAQGFNTDLSTHFYGRAVEYAMDQDRRWFEEHPGATFYVRPYIDGEMGLVACRRVRVVLMGKGARSRQPAGRVWLIFRGFGGIEDEMLRGLRSMANLPADLAKLIKEKTA